MKIKYLTPLTLQENYYDEIEHRINQIFYKTIFAPLFEIIKEQGKEIKNSLSPENSLVSAIRDGKVFYEDRQIKGQFNAQISKALRELGAQYDGRTKSWHLDFLPAEVQIAIAQAESLNDKIMGKYIHVLDNTNVDEVIETEGLRHSYFKTVGKIDDNFTNIVKKITIPPKLTPQAQEAIAKSWSNNLELYIKNWTDESILKLRTQIQSNAMRGQRSENMVRAIVSEYGVSVRKAKFLARQETALLMSNFQMERYKDVGISKYKWSASMDSRTRDLHKDLNGKIFLFSNPPISGAKGERENPGQPYNCRCIAIPIVEFNQ